VAASEGALWVAPSVAQALAGLNRPSPARLAGAAPADLPAAAGSWFTASGKLGARSGEFEAEMATDSCCGALQGV